VQRSRRRYRRRDRGFSLIVLFMLVIIMIGVAAAVMLSTQEDLAVSGQDREALTAFYSAEYGVAQAKDWLSAAIKAQWPIASSFTDWGPILTTLRSPGVTQGCLPTTAGAMTWPVQPRMNWQEYNAAGGTSDPWPATGPGHVMWRFCIHNNADDIAYLDTAGDTGAPCNGATGDTCDAREGAPGAALHTITVDAWGAFPVDPTTNPPTPLPGAAVAHVAVNLSPPVPKNTTPVGNCGYGVEGGCGAHAGNSGADNGNVSTGYMR
jgi:hypothetical protein